jgi:hypothetical protein
MRMLKAHIRCAVLAVVALLALVHLQPAAAETRWRRGINMGDYLAYPQSETWPIFKGPRATVSDSEMRRLATAGFDFVRLAVEPRPFIERSDEEIRISEQRLVDFIRRAHVSGLKVIVTGWARHESPRFSPVEILKTGRDEAFRRYLAFLVRLAEVTRPFRGDKLALEFMNEPQGECFRTDGGPDWSDLQRVMFREVRAAAPDLILVITPACWSKLEGLKHIQMADFDRRTLVDVHYYEPWAFTHQGATWALDWIKYLAGLSYPPERTDKGRATSASARLFATRRPDGKPAEFEETLRQLDWYAANGESPARIRFDLDAIAAWAKAEGLSPARVIVGEFGALRDPDDLGLDDDGSRLRWITIVRQAAEAAGLGWAHWSYHDGFGLVVDEATGSMDPGTLDALGLKRP